MVAIPMNLKNWHYGKIVILWIWCLILIMLIIKSLEFVKHFVPGFLLIAVICGMLITMSVITWKWLGGKEN